MKKIYSILAMFLFLASFAFAATATISDITAPVTKIYDLVKAIVSILGILAITVAGAMYMFSGNNIQNRENAKAMISYSVVGLVLVWIAPMVVTYLTA